MYIDFLLSDALDFVFDPAEFFIKLGIPKKAQILENIHFYRGSDVEVNNSMLKSNPLIKQFYDEWQEIDLCIQTWRIAYEKPTNRVYDYEGMLDFISQCSTLKDDLKLIKGYPISLMEEFERETQEWYEEAKGTEELYSSAPDYPELVEISLLNNFWDHFIKGLLSVRLSPDFMKFYQENICLPLEYENKGWI